MRKVVPFCLGGYERVCYYPLNTTTSFDTKKVLSQSFSYFKNLQYDHNLKPHGWLYKWFPLYNFIVLGSNSRCKQLWPSLLFCQRHWANVPNWWFIWSLPSSMTFSWRFQKLARIKMTTCIGFDILSVNFVYSFKQIFKRRRFPFVVRHVCCCSVTLEDSPQIPK